MNRYAEIFPPGEFLRDELEARNWSQTEFAEIIGRPVRLVNELIAGKRAVTPETAIQLSASLGTSPELWMNLESQYQLSKVPAADDAISRKAKLYDLFPVRELVRRGWVSMSDKFEELERNVLAFYRIGSSEECPAFAHAARKTEHAKATPLQLAWLFRAKQIAETQVVPKYSRDALVAALPRLRALMSAPEEVRNVPRMLSEMGVRYALVEALPSSKIDGVCFWLEESPVIAMSARLDRIDNYWFVLRHELEHVIQEHGKGDRPMIDEDLDADSATDDEEKCANGAAQEFGVSTAALRDYMNRVNPYFFSEQKVLGFSGRIGVHPGIVVGRLQKTLEKSDYPNPYKFLRSYLVKVRHLVAQSAPTDGWGNIFPI